MDVAFFSHGRHWPVHVRRRRDARRATLRVAASGRITLTLPTGTSRTAVTRLLRDATPWLESRLAPVARALVAPVPASIRLPPLGQCWRVLRAGAPEPSAQWVLTLPDDDAAAMAALRTWLKGRARAWLPARVAMLAERHGFAYRRVTVRHQRSRWGSCSARGDISLNCLALLLPPEAVDHLILHELCHTRVPDHSPRFWRALAACQADWRHWDRYLSRAMHELPLWALPP